MSAHSLPSRRRKPIALAVAGLLLAGVLGLSLLWPRTADGAATATAAPSTPVAPAAPAAPATAPKGIKPVAQPVIDAKDQSHEAALVADQDDLITSVRTQASQSRLTGKNWKSPYQLPLTTGYVIVLTPSATPYTLNNLFTISPDLVQRLTDGSVYLKGSIAVMPGATLQLSEPNGLTLRMMSDANGFVSILSIGGSISMSGSTGHPLVLTSWDLQSGTPDNDTTDGRSYVRAIGGQFKMDNVNVSDLGFWSGRTGGIALTGTTRPQTGSLGPTATSKSTSKNAPTVLPAGHLPAGSPIPGASPTDDQPDFVSSSLSNTTVTQCAFGLFVSGADGLQLSDDSFTHNQIGGVLLHRNVTTGSIVRTTSSFNGGDGFLLDRATQAIQVSEDTANGNAGSGFVLSGRPLADGPSAVGSSTAPYGNNSVSGSIAAGNAAYGIQVLGGINITVTNNQIRDSNMGIGVSYAADNISITANQIDGVKQHGISLTDGVSAGTLTGNVITGASGAIYLRDSAARIIGNTAVSAKEHGISVIGSSKGTSVSANTLSGQGTSAIDVGRASDHVDVGSNHTSWHDTTPWTRHLRVLLHPMTIVWGVLFALVLLTAIRGTKQRGHNGIAHPYAHQMERLTPAGVTDQTQPIPGLNGANHIDPELVRSM